MCRHYWLFQSSKEMGCLSGQIAMKTDERSRSIVIIFSFFVFFLACTQRPWLRNVRVLEHVSVSQEPSFVMCCKVYLSCLPACFLSLCVCPAWASLPYESKELI